ncbi:hypothetical protein [Methylobacterium sp. Leaf87]|uniref:hypothetical protein n=1 Tax=Methylobacterium sp. Leaf87 TaxID=1736243 RepID=UPI0012E980D7|nr:hypothetical protein [Methylobacterium sp. Leaf87]
MTEDTRSLGDLLSDPEWVRSRQEQPRIEAENLVSALSILVGEDPDRVLEGLHKDEPLARALRKLLAIEAVPVNVGGRPRETEKHLRELAVLVGFKEQGLKGRALYDQVRAELGYRPDQGPDNSTLRKNKRRFLERFGKPNGLGELMVILAASRRKRDTT